MPHYLNRRDHLVVTFSEEELMQAAIDKVKALFPNQEVVAKIDPVDGLWIRDGDQPSSSRITLDIKVVLYGKKA